MLKKFMWSGIIFIVMASGIGCEQEKQQEPAKPYPEVLIATQSIFTGYVIFVAHEKGYFSDGNTPDKLCQF